MRRKALGMVAVGAVVLGCGGRARTDADESETAGGAGGSAAEPGAGGAGNGSGAGGAGNTSGAAGAGNQSGAGGAGAAGGATDPLWGCLDQPRPPSRPGTFKVRLHVAQVNDQRPLQGASVLLCRTLDPDCAIPQGRALTDMNGDAALEVLRGATVFVLITQNPATMPQDPEMLPAYYFLNPAIVGDVSVNVTVMNARLLDVFHVLLEAQPLPDRGMVLVSAVDCRGLPARDVAFRLDTADPLTTPFYVEGGVPIASRTSTNADGFGGVVNVAAGDATVSGEILANVRRYGDVGLFVRPNALVQTQLIPTGK